MQNQEICTDDKKIHLLAIFSSSKNQFLLMNLQSNTPSPSGEGVFDKGGAPGMGNN